VTAEEPGLQEVLQILRRPTEEVIADAWGRLWPKVNDLVATQLEGAADRAELLEVLGLVMTMSMAVERLASGRETRDRELLARHLRSLASAVNVEDWPAYIRSVADGHATGTSWYRP
jgi:hypothetical protein